MNSLATGEEYHPLIPVPGLAPSRKALLIVEAALKRLPQVEAPVTHMFAPGNYARTMYIPAGTALTGKIHRHAHLNILLEGEIDVLTERGMIHMVAPQMFVSAPGTKRAGFAHTDTVWVTIHPTNSTDLDEIEKEVIADSFETFDADAGIIEGELVK